jgi:hypothetical protein
MNKLGKTIWQLTHVSSLREIALKLIPAFAGMTKTEPSRLNAVLSEAYCNVI